ncbi:Exopolygalacturonase [Drechslerella dactyloides]|uniref:Exopolygalacturonase n=1 Tax=Drechslerella dactyloides TaxID=74499 RepID=A0AAD6IT99_DREDA|nr:Exopolygalacturonase [Drechslerella dactyloides]
MKLVIIGLALCATALAAPSAVELTPDRVVRRAVCTPAASASSGNDAPAIVSAIASCGNGGTIVIPAGLTYYLKDSINFTGCANCDFQIEGTLKANGDTNLWNGKRAFLQVSKITGVKIRSVTGSGVIDGNGQNSYDRFATDTSFSRPSMIEITNSKNVEIYNFWQKNPPSVFNSVKDTTNINFHNLKLSAISKSSTLPKNTDGFATVRTSYATIKDIDVTNTDDCVAPKAGTTYLLAQNVKCTGSHGLSIGSLGKSGLEEVKHILFKDCTMINSSKAAGIKTYPGGYGSSNVVNVTWDGVTVNGCDYAFQVQSCYNEDASYCASHPGVVSLSQIRVRNFSGTTSGKYKPTANINCAPGTTCDVQISGWTAKTPNGQSVVYCANTPSNLGVTCSSGASGKKRRDISD